MQTHVGLDQEWYSPMMKADIFPLDLELKTFNHIQTERIFLTSNQLKVLDVVARALGQTIAEYITDSLLSMMECDIDETVTHKLKEEFTPEPMTEVLQS
jgi:hypothetical protein